MLHGFLRSYRAFSLFLLAYPGFRKAYTLGAKFSYAFGVHRYALDCFRASHLSDVACKVSSKVEATSDKTADRSAETGPKSPTHTWAKFSDQVGQASRR